MALLIIVFFQMSYLKPMPGPGEEKTSDSNSLEVDLP